MAQFSQRIIGGNTLIVVDNDFTFVVDTTNNRVGVKTTNPLYVLDVDGDIRSTGNIYANTDLLVSGQISANGTGDSLLVADTLRIAQTGSGLRMTNVGAFDNDGSNNFRIFGTNDLILAANGETGTAITIDAAAQDVTISNDLRVGTGAFYINSTQLTATATELNQLDGVTLGTAASANTGDFATAAQGALADTALQVVTADGVTITGDGTPGNPLVAAGGGGGTPGGNPGDVQVNDGAGGFGAASNLQDVAYLQTVATDGTTITGDGAGTPLSAPTDFLYLNPGPAQTGPTSMDLGAKTSWNPLDKFVVASSGGLAAPTYNAPLGQITINAAGTYEMVLSIVFRNTGAGWSSTTIGTNYTRLWVTRGPTTENGPVRQAWSSSDTNTLVRIVDLQVGDIVTPVIYWNITGFTTMTGYEISPTSVNYQNYCYIRRIA